MLHSLFEEQIAEKALADAKKVGHEILKGDKDPSTLFAFVEHVALYSTRSEARVFSYENAELLRLYNRIEAATHGFGGSGARNLNSESRAWAKRMRNLPLESVTAEANGQQVFRNFTHQAAQAHAEANGLRLPTPYELAKLSESRRAKGVAESAYYDVPASDARVDQEIKDMKAKGYLVIFRPGQPLVVDFYFNRSGYVRPAGQEGNRWFWSSSVHPNASYSAYVLRDDGALDNKVRLGFGDGALRGVRVR